MLYIYMFVHMFRNVVIDYLMYFLYLFVNVFDSIVLDSLMQCITVDTCMYTFTITVLACLM